MQVLTTIFQYVLAIAGLSLIIIVHESGHFIAAKASGIYVEEFFIGIGPKIFKIKSKSGTTYGISAIPVGGYNKLLGMDRSEAVPAGMEEKTFHNKSFFKKFLVCISGSGFNIVFAVILIIIFLSMGVWAPSTTIEYIQPESPANVSGFEKGDDVIAINGRKIDSWDDFSEMTKEYPDQEVTYTIVRDGKEMEMEAELENIEGQGFLGISPLYVKVRLGFFEMVKESFKILWDVCVFTVKAVGMLFRGELSFSEARPVSPVGVVSIFQQSVKMGFQDFIFFIALVSIMLGFGNLLPILPLDGGNIVLVAVESIRKKPIPKKLFEIFNSIGIFILISILLIGFIFDIISPFDITNI
jgi:regulator of sigma E protease